MNWNKNWALVILFLLVSSFLTLTLLADKKSKPKNMLCYQNTCFEVKLAQTKAEKRKGLQGRRKLGQNQGMLFIYPKERQLSFWMKDTLIPLDIIWLNKNKEVIKIKHKAQPCKSEPCPTFEPEEKSQYVLEIKGGRSKEIGLKEGKKLKFNIKSLSK